MRFLLLRFHESVLRAGRPQGADVMLKTVAGAGALLFLTMNAVMAQTPTTPITPVRPSITQRLICADPAIRSLTLTKGAQPGEIQFSFEVVNVGGGPWVDSIYGNVDLIVIGSNGRDRPSLRFVQRLPARAETGARMVSFTSAMVSFAFDTSDDFRGGSVELIITLGPTITRLPRAALCPNHAANDRLVISHAEGRAFMESADRTRTYRP
jgi:hypothetical protein